MLFFISGILSISNCAAENESASSNKKSSDSIGPNPIAIKSIHTKEGGHRDGDRLDPSHSPIPGEKTAGPPGRWRERRDDDSQNARQESTIAPWQREQSDQLDALGYVQGSRKAVREGGITKYDRERAENGLNLYVSGHAPVAVLMDMEGNLLHKWEYSFDKAWPRYPGEVNPEHTLFWRRAYLFPNGDLLAIFEGLGMIKLDKNSKLIWKSALRQHHDITLAANGDIYTLTRIKHIIPRINPYFPIMEDFITILNRKGKPIKNVSLIEALENSGFIDKYWDKRIMNRGDIFHTNAVEILDGKIADIAPEFSKGRVLTAMNLLNTVFVVDLDSNKVVWGYKGNFYGRHDPQILPNGNLLILENRMGDSEESSNSPDEISNSRNPEKKGPALKESETQGIFTTRGRMPIFVMSGLLANEIMGQSKSGVVEFALPEMEPLWSYAGNEEDPFYTLTCGTVQRLANGDTLITETDNGRAFEVTPGGEIVWEFDSPHRAGENGDLVASLFEVRRLPADFGAWLKKK